MKPESQNKYLYQIIWILTILNNYNYSFGFTFTETSASGILLYITNHRSHKCCNDLNIYKNWIGIYFYWNCQPEEIKYYSQSHLQKSIYGLCSLYCNYLKKILDNVSKEQKSIFLLRHFDVNLLNYDEHNETNEFSDSLTSNSFIPLILQPTRITSHSNTLIDKIFPNVIDPDIILNNMTATISDHLPQFAIIPKMFGNILGNKSNIYDWEIDYFFADWEDLWNLIDK